MYIVFGRKCEWVIADPQNSHHSVYQSITPTSSEDCGKIPIERLRGYLK